MEITLIIKYLFSLMNLRYLEPFQNLVSLHIS